MKSLWESKLWSSIFWPSSLKKGRSHPWHIWDMGSWDPNLWIISFMENPRTTSGIPEWGYPKIDGFWWNIPWKWMILAYRLPPMEPHHSFMISSIPPLEGEALCLRKALLQPGRRLKSCHVMGIPWNQSPKYGVYWGFHKWGYPQIIHFNRIFPYQPSSYGGSSKTMETSILMSIECLGLGQYELQLILQLVGE